jgi:hypothetical protein
MPMSWIVTGVGLVCFLASHVAASVTQNTWKPVQVATITIDWKTGSIVTQGGLAQPRWGTPGYNLGNFIFVSPTSSITDYGAVVGHEAGHTLNVAAYGGIFHFIGAIDENIGWPPRDTRALGELYAESNDPTPTDFPPGLRTARRRAGGTCGCDRHDATRRGYPTRTREGRVAGGAAHAG